MTLTSMLLVLKLLSVSIEPERPTEKDDLTLAACALTAMIQQPSGVSVAIGNDPPAELRLIIGNHTGVRIHVVGKLIRQDGTTLVEVNHVTHGFNHTLCNQANGLLDEMAKTLAKQAFAKK